MMVFFSSQFFYFDFVFCLGTALSYVFKKKKKEKTQSPERKKTNGYIVP